MVEPIVHVAITRQVLVALINLVDEKIQAEREEHQKVFWKKVGDLLKLSSIHASVGEAKT